MNITDHLVIIISIVILLALSAFFSGSETALFSLPRSYIEEVGHGDRKKKAVAVLLEKPRMLLVTILFANLLVNIANTSAVTALSIRLFGERGPFYAVLVMTALILIFGEISPKSFALKNARRFALASAPALRILMTVLAPIRRILGWVADISVETSRTLFGESKEAYGSGELAVAVELGHQDGLFDEFEKKVLTNLFQFADTSVYEVLTPRVDVFSLDAGTQMQDAVIQIRNRGFSRIPLYSGSAENIVGVIHARDLLRYPKDERITLDKIMRPVKFVPETKKIRELLGELITDSEHVAVALDEHGSYEGIVTLEDILEEIFGEIRDRLEPVVEDYYVIDPDNIVAEGTMELEKLAELFSVSVESREVETVAGFITEMTGRIPREGEAFVFDGMRFLVLSSGRTKINRIRITRLAGEEDGDGPA